MSDGARRSVFIVGAGSRFLSGISYYTHRLATELAKTERVCVILMRQLLPTRLYPGRARIGKDLADMDFGSVPVHDGVDWFWFPSLLGALRLLRRERPDVVVFQWWTGTVIHTYVLLAWVAKRRGAKIVVEFHETLDTGEARIPGIAHYVSFAARRLMALADGYVVHSQQDLQPVRDHYGLGSRPGAVIPHGPYDQYTEREAAVVRHRDDSAVCRLLFFGLIRPYKGLEDLIEAFNALEEAEASSFHLTVVGETWEGWTLPRDLIDTSPHREHITFVNRYVHDDEVREFFGAADAVVLPYRRSAASGPLSIAMSYGLPIIATDVGGIPEAVEGYEGAVLVPPRDPGALTRALREVRALTGFSYANPRTWESVSAGFDGLFSAVSDH
jgi:glycosyltransferase involved in cell wall biosynthesis